MIGRRNVFASAVKWLVAERMADPALLRKSPPRLPEDRLMTLVAGIHSSNPDLTLREIAAQLEIRTVVS